MRENARLGPGGYCEQELWPGGGRRVTKGITQGKRSRQEVPCPFCLLLLLVFDQLP